MCARLVVGSEGRATRSGSAATVWTLCPSFTPSCFFSGGDDGFVRVGVWCFHRACSGRSFLQELVLRRVHVPFQAFDDRKLTVQGAFTTRPLPQSLSTWDVPAIASRAALAPCRWQDWGVRSLCRIGDTELAVVTASGVVVSISEADAYLRCYYPGGSAGAGP